MIPTKNLTRFIHQQERKFQGSTGELSDLLNSIAFAVKIISNLVATAGFRGLTGYTKNINVQGETRAVLDEESDNVLVELLGSSGHFGLLVSEERDTVISTTVNSDSAKYIVAFDPLDGSSNVSSNIPVGTIFTIFKKRNQRKAAAESDFLQTGSDVVAAGYALYGAKTSFVYSSGQGVHGFTLDPTIGEFLLTDEDMKIPERAEIYSINEANSKNWEPKVQRYIDKLKDQSKENGATLTARYVGSLVADFDRNLRKGGIYIYPADSKSPNGKLRLLYECIPLAFIAVQAGGMATDGNVNILDIKPQNIHQRSPLFIGSKREIKMFSRI